MKNIFILFSFFAFLFSFSFAFATGPTFTLSSFDASSFSAGGTVPLKVTAQNLSTRRIVYVGLRKGTALVGKYQVFALDAGVTEKTFSFALPSDLQASDYTFLVYFVDSTNVSPT